MEIRLMENTHGYEIVNEGVQLGKIVWEQHGNTMVMNGTVVDPSLRGLSMGQQLLDKAANHARQQGFKMKAVCPYVVKMFEKSSDYDDVKL